jgi:hypothetical protein
MTIAREALGLARVAQWIFIIGSPVPNCSRRGSNLPNSPREGMCRGTQPPNRELGSVTQCEGHSLQFKDLQTAAVIAL